MNALRKISIDTVLLALAVVLCLVALALLGGAAWITVIGVGAAVTLGAPTAYSPLTVGTEQGTAADTEGDGPPSRAGAPGSSREPAAPMHVLSNTLIARRQERAADVCGSLESARRMLESASQEPPRCTGTSATWCPIHGDCSCPYIDGNEDEGRTLDDPSCPLHAFDSTHSETDPAETGPIGIDDCDLAERQAAEIERLKVRVAELSESVDLLDSEGRKMKAERDDAVDARRSSIAAITADGLVLVKRVGEVVRERDEARAEVAALKLSVSGVRSAFADGEASERRKRDITIERLQGELDAARAEIERRADPFPPGRGPETCGTHCARCGEKIHLVRPTTGPDREERLENHCCPGGAS